MKRDIEPLLTELLARWHRWASSPVQVEDTLLRDFDALVSRLSPRLRAAIMLQGRNAAGGAQVWSSYRVDAATAKRARACLREALSLDHVRWFGPERIKVNARGNRIGESNPRAELPDADVERLLELRAEGYSYGWLSRKFEVPKSTVQAWCNGQRRGQTVARVKVLE